MCDSFLYDCFLNRIAFKKTIVFEKKILLTIVLTIVYKESSLTIITKGCR